MACLVHPLTSDEKAFMPSKWIDLAMQKLQDLTVEKSRHADPVGLTGLQPAKSPNRSIVAIKVSDFNSITVRII